MRTCVRDWLLCALLAGCASASAPPPPPAPRPESIPPPPSVASEPLARASARLDAGAAHVEVSLEIPLAWVTVPYERVRLRFRDERFREREGGYGSFVLLAGGSEWKDELPKPADGVVRVRYAVALTHHRADPVVGVDEVPHPTRGGWFLNGRALFPSVAIVQADGTEKSIDLATELSFALPSGFRLETSADAERSENVLRAESIADLVHAIYYAGRFEVVEAKREGVAVRIVTSDFAAADLAPLQSLVERTLALASQKLGPPSADRVLIAFDRHPERAGGVVGRGISLLYPEAPDGRATSPLGIVVVHELAHLYNRAEPPWLNEGFARYFELAFSARLDAEKPAAAAERLLAIHAAYARAKPGTRIADTDGALAYAAGAVLAFCVDAHLRTAKSSLFEAHRAAREQGRRGPIDPRLLGEAIRERSEASARYMDELLQAPAPIDFGACLKRAGYAAVTVTYPGISPEALAVDVLGIRGHDTASATVLRSAPEAPLQPGDRIESVDGHAVKSIEDLPYILRAKKPGAPIALSVRRGSELLRVALRMPELRPADRPRLSRYTITRAPTTGPLLD